MSAMNIIIRKVLLLQDWLAEEESCEEDSRREFCRRSCIRGDSNVATMAVTRALHVFLLVRGVLRIVYIRVLPFPL